MSNKPKNEPKMDLGIYKLLLPELENVKGGSGINNNPLMRPAMGSVGCGADSICQCA